MKFRVKIDGVDHQVVSSPDGVLSIDSHRFDIKLNKPSEDRRVVQVGEKTYEIRISESDVEAGLHVLEVAGERIPISVMDISTGGMTPARGTAMSVIGGRVTAGPTVAGPGRARSAEPSTAGTQDADQGVSAPMPGKIVKILVSTGDTVQAGDPVVTLEAMKMENELCAAVGGTVKAIPIQVGDSVESGQLLVSIG